MSSFFLPKCFVKFLCAYSLGLKFLVQMKSAQKLFVKVDEIDSSCQFNQHLWAAFSYQMSFCEVFMCLQFEFEIFSQNEIGPKPDRKMLTKLTWGWQIDSTST